MQIKLSLLYKTFFLCTSIIVSIGAHSQTIINAEQLYFTKDSLAFSIKASYSGNRGNAVTDKFKLAPSFLVVGKKNDLKVFGGYSVLSTSNKSYLNNGFAHIRHNYKLTTRLKTFEFYQIQFNEVLLLNKREVFGAGLRYGLFKKDSISFDLGIGAMHESEFLNPAKLLVSEVRNTFLIRATAVSSFAWILNKYIRLNNVLYYQPDVTQMNDYRILNDFRFTTKITANFNISTSLTIRYDSKPPEALTNFDSKMNVGLTYRFSK